MDNLLIAIVFTLIGVNIFKFAIKIINKYDLSLNETLKIKEISIIIFIILISTSLLYYKYTFSIDFIFLFYLSIYLLISSYVDIKTMYVYSLYNYITIIISIFYFVLKVNFENFDVTSIIINVIIYMLISSILTKNRVYGGGDNEIFIVVSLFISMKYPNFILGALLLNVIISNIIVISLNLKSFNKKKFKFSRQVAFAPSIALSTMILLLI